jgi:hypothetical protein
VRCNGSSKIPTTKEKQPVNQREQKYLVITRTLSEGKATKAELAGAQKAIEEIIETEQVEFNNFQHKVGEVFLKIREELDQGLTDMAEQFPEETDPRKWDVGDWYLIDVAVAGHKFEELYRTYAEQKTNLHLMWKEIETRL